MENNKYRIAFIKTFDSNELYLCEDENIKENDYVIVEGKSNPVQIQKLVDDIDLYPINELKKVMGRCEENKMQLKESLNEIKVITDVGSEFSYIDYHADCLMKIKDDSFTTSYSLIKKITLRNHTEQIFSNLTIRIIFSNDAFQMNDITIKEITDYEESVVRIPFLKVDKKYIETLNEKETATVKIELIDFENKLLYAGEHNFVILPISQPSKNVINDSRLYAKYITPSAAKVKQIALNAVKHNNNKAIITYQNKGTEKYNNMIQEAQAIYLALHEWGIAYQNPPAGGIYTQRIRTPEEVLKDKKGTCLDLAMLYCACLAEVRFNTILVLTDKHAFAGFFLDDKINFPNAIEYRCGRFYNLASGGMNKIVLVECNAFTATYDISFQQAVDLGLSNIKNYEGQSFSAIDISFAHRGIFSPIPTQGEDENLKLLIEPKEIKDKKLDSIIESKYIDILRQGEKDRFTFWERKLLDLTEANPLVNFRMKSSNCLKITCDKKIQDLLQVNDNIKFMCLPIESNIDNKFSIENEFLKGTLKPSDVFGKEFDKEKMLAIGFEKTLKNLVKKSNLAMDETGAPTLYLCLGLLTYNRKKGHLKGHAPFMVLPIKVTKDKLGPYYTMTYDYDNIMINQTFFEYYKQEHPGIDFSELYQITADDKYLDIIHSFKANNNEDIQLDEESFFIANLTFAHYIMWQDVRNRKDELKKNKVIQSILENKNMLDDVVENQGITIDETEKYDNFAAPLSYDSTQLRAILKCGEGKSFILDGPPGTGKSQTIVNMIVNAFYHGKTVLFVAEKKAALDVVADRLRKLGDCNTENNLGRFCLELHSNKANKTEFFSKLKTSMELGVTKEPEEFERKCQEIEEKRDKLLVLINKMHQRKYYYSLYEAIVKQEELKELTYYDKFDDDYLLMLDDEKRQKTYNLIEKYIAIASNINDFNNNPLKIVKTDNINFNEKEEVINDFNTVKGELIDFLNSYQELTKDFSISFSKKYDIVEIIMDIISLCVNSELYVDALAEYITNDQNNLVRKIINTSEKYLILQKQVKELFNLDAIYDINASLAITQLKHTNGFFKKLKVRNKWKKTLKNVILPTHKLNTKNLYDYFKMIQEYKTFEKYLKEQNNYISKFIDCDYFSNIKNYRKIEKNYFDTREFINKLLLLSKNYSSTKVFSMFTDVYKNKDYHLKLIYTECYNKLLTYKKDETELLGKYKIAYKMYEDNGLEKYINLLEYASNERNFNELIDMSQINQLSHELGKLGLEKILEAVIQEKFDFNDFKETYDLSCVNGYIKMYFRDKDINYFNPETFALETKKYKDLINEYNNLVVASVSSRLTKNLNHSSINYANSSPIGRLKKSISSNGRGVSIRETLLKYDDIIKKYFPCFLMSPLSAAQYLAVDDKEGKAVSKFDLVIFDEASQIPTHEAVGPIARGNSLIVAGDPEQMPPSAYFSAGLELADDEVQYEDAISLLDECIAIELPRIRLAYHYRSKHESLINFSNHNFYNDSLYTFPSPTTANSFVDFEVVDIAESKKNSNITKEEINAICDKFKAIYTNDKTKHKSVGIIVFNMKQQERLYDAITELLANDRELNKTVEEAINQNKEPWFVKSLENVQGDERDIIILSIGFRKNAAGRAVVIGPLARENGQRRLNVAVSRSKERMIVISTIRYTDFDEDSKIRNKGQLLLKQFLKFAEENTFKPCGTSEQEKGTIISFIKKDLENRGFKVVSNVGNSDFKVDLAIKNKTEDLYELGILIDSKDLGQNISCRDKLYVQESVLNALKWKIINIYTLEYFKDPKGTIDKIIDAIDKPYIKEEYHIDAIIEKDSTMEFTYNVKEYQKESSSIAITYDNDSGFDNNINKLLLEIVLVESPIAFETIKDRIREHSNIQSMSLKAKNRLQSELKKCHFNITYDQTQNVYWSTESKQEINEFRVNSGRDINDIPKEEILCAMKQILDVQGKISKEDLFKCTLEAFGYGQAILNKKNQERLEYVYNWALTYNKIDTTSNKL